MNRFICIFVTFTIFYLINQPDFVHSASWGNQGASKLNLGVWIPPMTLRLPKFNMPKIKISATIKPRKNQPAMKIHLPEMSLNAKALGDDDNYGGGGGGQSYGNGGGESYSNGDSGGYSGGAAPAYPGGGQSYGGESYGGGAGAYSDGNSAGGYGSSGGSGGYRASAASSQNNYQQPSAEYNQQQPNYNQNSQNIQEYGSRYPQSQADQRNTYYHVDNSAARYQQPESVSYGASNNQVVQSGYKTQFNPDQRTFRTSATSSAVQPLSNYIKKEKAQGSAYGYAVNSRYARN